MIVLDSTTKLLQIILAGAVTTNQLQFTASYADYVATPAAFTPGALSGLTNNTTAVTLVAAPAASTQRQVKRINVYNSDTAPATVTIRLSDAGNFRTQLSVTLQVGERIEYEDAEGFRVFTVTGAVKVTAVASTVEPGYIDGCQMQWVSNTALTLSTGTAYIPSVGANVNVTSAIAKVGIVLTASAFYHVYLFLNAGVPDIEIVTTAPSTPYNGVARTKTGDTTRRYIGTVLTNASSQIYRFLHVAPEGLIFYLTDIGVLPFYVLNAGVATVSTTISVATVVPTTSRVAKLHVLNTSTNAFVLLSNSEGPTVPTGFLSSAAFNTTITVSEIPLDSVQSYTYAFNAAPVGGTTHHRVQGYIYER